MVQFKKYGINKRNEVQFKKYGTNKRNAVQFQSKFSEVFGETDMFTLEELIIQCLYKIQIDYSKKKKIIRGNICPTR